MNESVLGMTLNSNQWLPTMMADWYISFPSPPTCLPCVATLQWWETGVLEVKGHLGCVLRPAIHTFGTLFRQRRAASLGSERSTGCLRDCESSGHHLAGWWTRVFLLLPLRLLGTRPSISLPLLVSLVGGGVVKIETFIDGIQYERYW